MQKVLEPGEIAALDASALPRIRLPERAVVFYARAQRLRALAKGNAIGGYLTLMATVVEAQHALLKAMPPATLDRDSLQLALSHGMPVVPATRASLDGHWREQLHTLNARVRDVLRHDTTLSHQAPAVTRLLDRLDAMAPDDLDRLADAVLERDAERVDIALAPFVFAALQVIWSHRVSALSVDELPYLDTPGLCPACGSPPVASILRIGGVHEGYRYLQCSLCATEFHMVRVKCACCDSTKGIAYHSVEDRPDADLPAPIDIGSNAQRESTRLSVSGTRAESCDECHQYVKIFAQEKLFDAEPFADDLASLALDLMMNEAGYARPHPHPFLWPSPTDESQA